MGSEQKLISQTIQRILSRYPRFGSEIAKTNIIYDANDPTLKTASTDGKNIFLNPTYFESLTPDERTFLIAHEFMHIKFNHMNRMVDKNGVHRDPYIWNMATDAIINANLERDGFKIKKGYINRPEALNYTAEEFYEILLKEEQKNQDQSSRQYSGSDHSKWGQKGKTSNEEKKSNSNQAYDDNSDSSSQDEKQEFDENRKERKNKAKENLQRMKKQVFEGFQQQADAKRENFGDVGVSQKEIDWRLLLRREIEKTETIWTQRRSIAENNYAYRLEENDIEEEAITEAMIDVSASVDQQLVKAFLRIVKQLLKHSTLKVGFFDHRFYGFKEISSDKDIDTINMVGGGNTDFNMAIQSFTQNDDVNKIIFTDGGEGVMPKESTKKEKVLWVVYGNKNFKPCCGKVIYITPEELSQQNSYSIPTNRRSR